MATLVARRRPSPRDAWDTLVLAAVAYVPFLLSDRGMLASDSKQALYVDPGGFLRDAMNLWDPGVGAGTVPHQHLGYLWPMGPWFWLLERLGFPDWVAQRLWLGSLTFAAAMGTSWLVRSLGHGRAAAVAAAFVYALSPYQLAFTSLMSVLLLPWAGLPWLVELTRRALDRGGWRHPALFALVVVTVAGVNAPTILLVGFGPGVVLAAEAVRGHARKSVATAGRMLALTVPGCAALIASLRVQAAYGIDVLAVTENVRTVSAASSPDEVLRGLGNWFFHGGDRTGPAIVQAPYYDSDRLVVLASLVLPAAALASLAVVRWRGRGVAVAMVATAVIAVGAWPYDDSTVYGQVFKWFSEGSSVGLAFRNAPRIVPVMVLGMALAISAAVRASPDRLRRGAAGLVCLAALAGMSPALRVGMLSPPAERPERIPTYWRDAARHLDERGADTRVLALPGANFAAYRWGNAVEPIAPLLMDRPFLAREVLPQGSSESALLLDALDRRLQNGVLDPRSVAPVARLLRVGDIIVRSDLAHDRFGLAAPTKSWETLTREGIGLESPVPFGESTPNAGDPVLAPLLPSDLAPGRLDRWTALRPVAVLAVKDPRPIVDVSPAARPVLLGGDADGIVDAAAAGVIDGKGLVLASPALTDGQFSEALRQDAHLVLTDSNRRRIQTWFYSIRDTRGPTEQAGEVIVEPSGYDHRLPSYPTDSDDARSVVEQFGATVTATAGGGAERPEDRPAAALDGHTETAWQVGGPDPTGNHLTVTLEWPRRIDSLRIVQPQDGPRERILTEIRIRVGEAAPMTVRLDERSLSPKGQLVEFPGRVAGSVDVELAATSSSGLDPATANAVGIAELEIGDLRVTETVRMPVDLLSRAGSESAILPLDLVMTRLRRSPDDWRRQADELILDRSFELPTARAFELSGTVRISDRTPDDRVDELFGTTGTARVTSSSRLQGSPESRASRAFDGDRSTRWTSAFGTGAGSWLQVDTGSDTVLDGVELDVVTDGRHSLPSKVTVVVDGAIATSRDLGSIVEGTSPGHTTRVALPFDTPLRGEQVRIVFDEVSASRDFVGDGSAAPPISISEVKGIDVDIPAAGTESSRCRSDLLTVDGRGIAVRVRTPVDDEATRFEGCGELMLDEGAHRIRAADPEASGWDVDSLHLASEGKRSSGAVAAAGGPILKDSDLGRTVVSATIRAHDQPFWFVLGESANAGWRIEVDGAEVGPRTVVDGYANGWLITPTGGDDVSVKVVWGPQRTVDLGLAISAATVLLCLLVITRTGRGSAPVVPAAPEFVGLGDRSAFVDRRTAVLLAASTAATVAFVSRVWIGLVCAVATLVVARCRSAAWLLAVCAPIALLAARALDRPELGWLALGLPLAATLPDLISRRLGLRSGR